MSYVQKLVGGIVLAASMMLLPSAAQAHGPHFVRCSPYYGTYCTPYYTTCSYPLVYQSCYTPYVTTPYVQTVVVAKPVVRVLPATYISANGTRVIVLK